MAGEGTRVEVAAKLDEAALAVHADSQSRYWKAASGIAEMRHIH